jgi:hypothetical protein
MPNTASVYTELTKMMKESDEDKPSIPAINEDDAGRSHLRVSWKASTITKEKIDKYCAEIASLLDEAVRLAVNYHTHSNHNKILANLIRIDTLKTIIKDYA